MNQNKSDDKKEDPENGGIKTPTPPVEKETYDPVPDGSYTPIQL